MHEILELVQVQDSGHAAVNRQSASKSQQNAHRAIPCPLHKEIIEAPSMPDPGLLKPFSFGNTGGVVLSETQTNRHAISPCVGGETVMELSSPPSPHKAKHTILHLETVKCVPRVPSFPLFLSLAPVSLSFCRCILSPRSSSWLRTEKNTVVARALLLQAGVQGKKKKKNRQRRRALPAIA